MPDGDSDAPEIKVTIHPRMDPPPALHEIAGAALMACLNCRATMVRGTQCDRCGAWCR